jgi:hypothetical protein
MTGDPYTEPMHRRTVAPSQKTLWSIISGRPPIVIGAAGVVILTLEGRILGALLVVLLIVMHRLAGRSLSRRYLSQDQLADWTAVHALTTACCLVLPFYLALTIG